MPENMLLATYLIAEGTAIIVSTYLGRKPCPVYDEKREENDDRKAKV